MWDVTWRVGACLLAMLLIASVVWWVRSRWQLPPVDEAEEFDARQW